MPAYVATARVAVAPRVSNSRRVPSARVPNTVPGAPVSRRPRGSPARIPNAISSPDSRMSDSEYSEFRAEDAIKRAVEGWKKLDTDAAHPTEDFQRLAREADKELSETRRKAAAEADASAEKLREAEAAAALWETRAREVRGDLEFTKKQLDELRMSSSSGGSSYGSSYGSSSGPSATERDALAKAEEAFHRLRQGEAKAGEQAKAAARELEDLKRSARESNERAEERIRFAESRMQEMERTFGDKDRDVRVMREALDRDLNALHRDLSTARAAVTQRDAVISDAVRERDEARAVADDREGVIIATRGDLDHAHATLHERDQAIESLTRERDEARHTAWEREQHIHKVEKERDDQSHLAWERDNVIKERDSALAEREKERDDARHEAWTNEQTLIEKNRALEEMEEIARQLAARALAAKDHKHQ